MKMKPRKGAWHFMEFSDIFESEHEENWRIVFVQYTELYRQSPSIDVAMHFAFFCWYLLWQWDEISFPGETLSPYEKGTVDTRNLLPLEPPQNLQSLVFQALNGFY